MDRLVETYTDEKGWHNCVIECKDKCKNKGIQSCHCQPILDVRLKLAEYEATGITPQEASTLRAELEAMRRERDAAVGCLRGQSSCATCKNECGMSKMMLADKHGGCDDWEWCGVRKEQTICFRCGTPIEEPAATHQGFPLCEACKDYAMPGDEIEYQKGER